MNRRTPRYAKKAAMNRRTPKTAVGGCIATHAACILGNMFDDFADVYDAMIDWPKRLAHEEPFYRRLFERLALAA